MYRIAICAALVAALSACSRSTDESAEPAPTLNTDDFAGKTESRGIEFGIGDVDAHAKLTTRLAEESAAPNVRGMERSTEREDLVRVDIDVSRPHPDELFLTVMFITHTDYIGHSVAGTLNIFVGDEKVETIDFLWGGKARQERIRHTIDVLEGIEELPDSLLVHATADLVLFKNTDKSTLDLEALPASHDGKVTRLGNPVRIRFLD